MHNSAANYADIYVNGIALKTINGMQGYCLRVYYIWIEIYKKRGRGVKML